MGRILEPEVMETEEEAAAYDELDRVWGSVLFQGFAESAARMGVVRGRVLDVGTGTGRLAIRLAKLNPDLFIEGIDLSKSMLKSAARNAAREGLAGRMRFSLGDAKQIPFPTHSFDLVICHQLLHQLPDPSVALVQINRVAKPAGAILVRDVRRLAWPLAMDLLIPVYCCRYGPLLRRLASDSFRAGLTRGEFQRLVREAGIERATVRSHLTTHLGLERPASPFEPFTRPIPRAPLLTRIMKWPFSSSGRPE